MVIPYSRQLIDKSDISAVSKVLKSDFLTTGPKVNIFEKKLENFFGSKYASVVNLFSFSLSKAKFLVRAKKDEKCF